MINRRDEHDSLEAWEKWPLAALFLANALNVFLLYVPTDEMPEAIQWLLPWVRVFCGIAAAASLEGTLIAVTMGRRLGRDSAWSWAAMFAASAFTAMVAYYVHASVGLAAAGLFMAQAVVLFIYTQHLAQPRKTLQPVASSASALLRSNDQSAGDLADIVLARPAGDMIVPQQRYPAPVLVDGKKLIACKRCGKMVTLPMAGAHGRNYARIGRCQSALPEENQHGMPTAHDEVAEE